MIDAVLMLHQADLGSSFAHPALHQIGKLFKHRAVAINNQLSDLTGDVRVVGVTGEVAATDHRLSNGIAGATDTGHTLINQEIPDQQPTEFMGELEGLNQAQLLQLTEDTGLTKTNAPLKNG